MPNLRHKFLQRNNTNDIQFPSYEPETPFQSLEDFNKQQKAKKVSQNSQTNLPNPHNKIIANSITEQLSMESPQPHSKNSSPKNSLVNPPRQPESSQCGEKPEIDNQNLHANYSSETSITYSNIKNLPNISQSSTSTGVSNMEAVPGCAATQEESNATTLASIENMEVEKVTRNQEVPSSGCHNETTTRNQNYNISDPNLVTAMSQNGSLTSDDNVANRYIRPQQEIIASDQQPNISSSNSEQGHQQSCSSAYKRISAADVSPPLVEKDSNSGQQRNAGGQSGKALTSTSFSDKVKQSNFYSQTYRTQRILRMKIVPPFRKEHFQNRQKLEDDVHAAITEILSIFQPKFRPMVTISRTNLPQQNRNLQILMVTAPEEAEEDLARAKLNGIQIMGKTVFPTGEEFWRYSQSEFPKRAMLRVNNLPILCSDEELEQLMELPEDIKFAGDLLRESEMHDLGRMYTGRAMIPIMIPTKEHENSVRKWSIYKNSENIAVWNEVPIYMSVPSLHKCVLCEKEGRRQVIGHDERWCRILRNTHSKVASNPEQEEPCHQEESTTDVNQSCEKASESERDVEAAVENLSTQLIQENEDDSGKTNADDDVTSNAEDAEDSGAQSNEEQWSKTDQKKKPNKKKRKRTALSTTTSGTKSTTSSPRKGPQAKQLNLISNG